MEGSSMTEKDIYKELENGLILRLVQNDELNSVKTMYKKICRAMRDNGIRIWDYNYPCGYIKYDIEDKRLIGLYEKNICVGSFALCVKEQNEYPAEWEWQEIGVYCERVAVDVDHQRRGYGAVLYREAKELTAKLGYNSLRVVIVDTNEPALGLVKKCGFYKKEGVYLHHIDDAHILSEYAFEAMLPEFFTAGYEM